jgi:hypothetical protein
MPAGAHGFLRPAPPAVAHAIGLLAPFPLSRFLIRPGSRPLPALFFKPLLPETLALCLDLSDPVVRIALLELIAIALRPSSQSHDYLARSAAPRAHPDAGGRGPPALVDGPEYSPLGLESSLQRGLALLDGDERLGAGGPTRAEQQPRHQSSAKVANKKVQPSKRHGAAPVVSEE